MKSRPLEKALIASTTHSLVLADRIETQGGRQLIPKAYLDQGQCRPGQGLSRYRHLVENAFARLKHYRAVAFRYDKLKRNYGSMVAIACGFLWLPM